MAGLALGVEVAVSGGLMNRMHPRFNLAHSLDQGLRAAASRLGWDGSAFQPEVRPADPRFGDYQANGALAYAKRQKANPRQLAADLLAEWQRDAHEAGPWEATIAGPGFINFALRPTALMAWLAHYRGPEQLLAGSAGERSARTVVVDFSSPNTAKQMHVGHLRSAVIGEALCRLLEFSGARVIRDNHLGDWGTQFGILLRAYKRGLDAAAFADDPLAELERLYKQGQEEAKASNAALEEARQELVKLQKGDPENHALWRRFSEVSQRAFDAIYQRLGVRFDHYLGESFYNDKLERVFAELQAHGVAEDSKGALVVFHDEVPRFSRHAERPFPFIIRKEDGASNYASTDLATMLYRVEHFGADGIVVVTDDRQSDHFQQLWLTTQKWFRAVGRPLPEFSHVTFGKVCGEDGKPLKTRDGGTIKLRDLLDEAEERAFRLVTEKSPDLPEDERRAIARVVGVGSVQYADLSQNRSSDYIFSWSKMISLEGNTAAYLLYAVARIRSIFRKGGLRPGEGEAGASPLETPAELALARKLLKFPDALEVATTQLRPHFLCSYLYELAGDYSAFNNADKVLGVEPPTQARRLMLCARALLALETGLKLLGLRTLEKM